VVSYQTPIKLLFGFAMPFRKKHKTAADFWMRAQYAAQDEAAELQGEILRQKLKQLTRINWPYPLRRAAGLSRETGK